jgi:4-amino-4-deoxy-L-arabinose transferase-like glycosyltransferase
MKKSDWLVLLGFGALVFALRFLTFSRSVYDWDESLFLLMGRAILRGEVPYTTVWEHSPPGLPALFALGQAIFGYSVMSIRVLTFAAVTGEGFLLYKLGNRIGQAGAGLIAGLLYVLFSMNNGGLAAHRELFFAPLVTGAIFLVLTRPGFSSGSLRANSPALLLAGVLLGLGFQLKYLYGVDVAAVFAVIFFRLILAREQPWRQTLVTVVKYWMALAVGPLVILLAVAAYFWLNGHFSDYLFATLEAGINYAGAEQASWGAVLRRLINQVSTNLLPWLGLILLPFYLKWLPGVSRSERRNLVLLAVWLAFALFGALFSRRLFSHYFLSVLPPLCLMSGAVIAGVVSAESKLDRARRVLILALVLAGPLMTLGYERLSENAGVALRYVLRGVPIPVDTPTTVAGYLRERVDASDTIYVIDYEPILYYLVDARMPTRFVFPPFLTASSNSHVDGIDQMGELASIMATRPRYLIRQLPPSPELTNAAYAAAVEKHLELDYVLEQAVSGTDAYRGTPIVVELYRRKGP